MKNTFLKLLLVIFIFNTSCEKENTEETLINNNFPFQINLIPKSEFQDNDLVMEKLDNLIIPENAFSRTEENPELNFTVNTDYAKYVEADDGSVHSYTFLIERDEEIDNTYENLVLTSQPDGSYNSELIKYTFLENNNLEIKSGSLELDTSDYVSRSSFFYECTTTTTYIQTYNEDCSCTYVQVLDVETSCTYVYYSNNPTIDAGGSGGGGWGVWTGGGGGASGGGSSGGTVTSPTSPCSVRGDLAIVADGDDCVPSDNDDDINTIENCIGTSTNLNSLSRDVIAAIVEFINSEECSEENSQLILDFISDVIENNITEIPDLIVIGPDNPIENIAEYLSCFDTDFGAEEATVTVYVNEPVDGNNTIIGSDGVGHTFISIQQGDNIASFGFYPQTGILSLFVDPVPSVLDNDSNEAYDVSISIGSVQPGRLLEVINGAILYGNTPYGLHTNNCTDMGIVLGNIAGLDLPDASANPWIFFGSTPGRLGEHIRNMETPLPNNVSRNLDGGSAPNNNCN